MTNERRNIVKTGADVIHYANKWFGSLPIAEAAKRCGFGSRTNLYFAYQRDLRTTPSDRREKLRQQGDEGRYRME